ncbi:MAG: sensor domain-containing diguanylate cyclase [Thalassobaculales bacterium]
MIRYLRTRLVLLIAGILAAGFLSTNVISLRVSTAALKQTILQNELPLTSSNIYAEIQTDLLRPIFVSSLMANDTFMKDWVIAGEQDVDSITRYLDEIRRQYSTFTSFLISARTRNYYHFSGLSRQVRSEDPADGWFFRVRDMAAPYEVNIDVNQEQAGAITIFINYRVLGYDGQFLGVTGVGLNLKTVEAIISRYQGQQHRNIYFVDRLGRVMARSDAAPIVEDSIRAAPGIAAVADALLASSEGYFEYDRHGETYLLTTRLIPDLGWHVLVEQSEADALRGLWDSFLTNLAIGGLIVLITIATVAYAVGTYHRQLERMAVTDKLTGIGNREAFDSALAAAVDQRRRGGPAFAVLLFDVDHFKEVNDRLGHLRGDMAIRRVAQAMLGHLRKGDTICRWGGEELIVLARTASIGAACEIADRLRLLVAATPLAEPDDGLRVTISAGVVIAGPADTPDCLLSRADQALYRAKEGGRNRVEAAEEGGG